MKNSERSGSDEKEGWMKEETIRGEGKKEKGRRRRRAIERRIGKRAKVEERE